MKQFRTTLYVMGREVVSDWLPYNKDSFLVLCEGFAENDMAFTVEFQTIENGA